MRPTTRPDEARGGPRRLDDEAGGGPRWPDAPGEADDEARGGPTTPMRWPDAPRWQFRDGSLHEVAVLGLKSTKFVPKLPPRAEMCTGLPPRAEVCTGLPPRRVGRTRLPPRRIATLASPLAARRSPLAPSPRPPRPRTARTASPDDLRPTDPAAVTKLPENSQATNLNSAPIRVRPYVGPPPGAEKPAHIASRTEPESECAIEIPWDSGRVCACRPRLVDRAPSSQERSVGFAGVQFAGKRDVPRGGARTLRRFPAFLRGRGRTPGEPTS